ncbi:MAG: ribonuclease M5 [Clostridiales bacterium]|nr:ribonuclease M5 [Clostridiales bacterium]
MCEDYKKLKISQAIVVEGRDDVDAVSQACDALIIPTHGFGITSETLEVIKKAYEEKGIIILTDPDSAGEEIRKKLTERFPKALQAYVQREDALAGKDIGVENSNKEIIIESIIKAIDMAVRLTTQELPVMHHVTMNDLVVLGLAGEEYSSKLRSKVCGRLGIGYGNTKTMLKKLRGFGIGKDELEEAVRESKKREDFR